MCRRLLSTWLHGTDYFVVVFLSFLLHILANIFTRKVTIIKQKCCVGDMHLIAFMLCLMSVHVQYNWVVHRISISGALHFSFIWHGIQTVHMQIKFNEILQFTGCEQTSALNVYIRKSLSVSHLNLTANLSNDF